MDDILGSSEIIFDDTKLIDHLCNSTSLVGFAMKHPNWYTRVMHLTSFLTPLAGLRQRVWHVTNHNQPVPVCCVSGCTNVVRWHMSKKTYNPTCSVKCANNRASKKKKIKDTTFARYGVESFTQSELYAPMRDKSNLDKFGTTNPNTLPAIQQKRKQTLYDNYGVSVPLHSIEIQNRSNATKLKNYGTINLSTVQSIKDQTLNTKQLRFGRDNNSQCHISQKSLKLLSDNVWLHTQHIVNMRSCVDIGNELGVYNTTIHRYLLKHNIEIKRHYNSAPESELYQILAESNIHCIRNDRSAILPYELDLYIPSHSVAIEYCGLYWHADFHDRIDKNYHKRKYDMCAAVGIRLITIFEDEWIHHKDIVISKMMNILKCSNDPVVYARNTRCTQISHSDKIDFLNSYHIQGNGPGSITYGLLSNTDELVAVMTLISNNDNNYVLNRYATKYRVPGGFSKLLCHFTTHNQWNIIKTFADLRWSTGMLYDKMGFDHDGTLLPDYSYINKATTTRHHKFGYRHKQLEKKLQHYDPTLSERDNCDNNGILRIWDCGKLRYVKTNKT